MKTLEQALINQRKIVEYIWLLDNERVDIETISAHKLNEAIKARATDAADPDGPEWFGSGRFSDRREAYTHCAVAHSVLRLVTRTEWVLFQSIAEMSEEIEALQIQGILDGRELETHAAELTELRRKLEVLNG